MNKLLTYIIVANLFLSCENKVPKVATPKAITTDTSNTNSAVETENESDEKELNTQEGPLVFPKTGKKATDFLPQNNAYEIQYEAKGDLNSDHLEDLVVVLQHIENNTEIRPMLILLQNKDKSYRLDKMSNFAMPAEYNEHNYKIYDTEDINIDKGVLQIQLSAIGPSGNNYSEFKYINKDFILTNIETFNQGAGSWQELYYDLEKGEITEIITNTMVEDTPSEKKTIKLTKEKHKFENTSPTQIIIDVYSKIDSQW